MGPYSWPDRGSYCCSSEPPQQGLSVTDGTTEAFQGPFDHRHHPLYKTETFSFQLISKIWKNIHPFTYRKAHVSQLFDETVHNPNLIWLVAKLILRKQSKCTMFSNETDFLHRSLSLSKVRACFLTLFGIFLGALPQELQEELLSWEVGLFHISPSSASQWPISSPFPQLSCIGLGPKKKFTETKKERKCKKC